MLPYAELVVAMAAVPRVTLHGPWSRVVEHVLLKAPPPGSPGTQPEPLWASGSVLQGARFTPLGSFPTLYVACDPITALSEDNSILNHALLITTARARNPVVVVTIDGVLADAIDLTVSSTRALLGTSAAELTGSWLIENPPPTQELGRAAYECGIITALKYPSAKHPNGWCLAIFTDRLSRNSANYVEVVDTSSSLAQRLP